MKAEAAPEQALVLTVELVLFRWAWEAWILTAHMPRKRKARALLTKVLELARADVQAIPLTGTTPTEIKRNHAVRRQALSVLEEFVPKYLVWVQAGI